MTFVWIALLGCSETPVEVVPISGPGAPRDAPQAAAPAPAPTDADPVTAEKSDCRGALACATACDADDALACNQLALIEHDGRGGAPRAPAKAAAHYRKACDLGAGVGCYNLSHMVRAGDGVAADDAEADALLERTHRLYEKSCAAGGLTWCTNLAGLVQRGEGRDPDQGHARNLYRDTCERGDPIACLELAYMLREGTAGPADPDAAFALLDGACKGGSGPACNNLGLWTEERGDDPKPLFEQACQLEVAMACRNLAVRLPEEERLPLLEKACDAAIQLDPMACAIASQMYLQSTPPQPKKAGDYLVRACSVGLAEACMPAVQLAAQGMYDLPQTEGRRLIERGCRLGDAAACDVLKAPVP